MSIYHTKKASVFKIYFIKHFLFEQGLLDRQKNNNPHCTPTAIALDLICSPSPVTVL